MNPHRGIGLYRRLLRCYPRSFRHEYGRDMVLLFSDQLGDEPAPRVWCRALVDLAITVPNRHLEAHMHRPPSPVVPLAFAALGVAGMVLAVVAGTNPGLALGAAAVGAVALGLAVVSARQTRRITASTTSQWWKLIALGTGVLLSMIIAERATDLALWMPMVVTVLFAIGLIAAGLVLGVAHLLGAHSRPAAR
ncbi:MAG: hypothetical protein ABL966_15055 [Acidimicrobiales bacterium]